MTLILDFLCNNPDNGDFTGRCEAVQLPDEAIDLHCGEWGSRAGVTLNERGKKLYFGRIAVTPLGRRTWYGNWCWDAYKLTVEDAAKILAYCKKMGWQCEGGWCELADKYDSDGLTADDLRAAFAPTKPDAVAVDAVTRPQRERSKRT